MEDTGSRRVVFIADCDGVLASSLVRALAAPGVEPALQAGYRTAAARVELEQGGVSLGTVAVEPVDIGGWQCFQPTPSALDAVVAQVAAAATGQ